MKSAHTPLRPQRLARVSAAGALVLSAALLTGCATGSDGAPSAADDQRVTLVVHSSFPNEEFAKAASEATGYEVEVISAGDGGELTNKLVLTKGAPIADAFFGVDTIFASRLIEAGAVEPYVPAELPAGAVQFAVPGDAQEGPSTLTVEETGLVPVDFGSTCVNIDTGWFAKQGIAEPASYEDLTKAEYKDLTVLLDPTASSTGASFLVGTVAAFGAPDESADSTDPVQLGEPEISDYVDYWQQLLDNGARIEQGWSDAYYGQFSQGGEDGTKPIVVSYASSPAFTVNESGDETTTRALLDTCTRQAEYAGVLEGAANPEGARAVVDYLVSHEFQGTVPEAMFMNPVDETVALPEAWAKFAPEPTAEQAHDLTPVEIERGREAWLRALADEIGL